MKPDSLASQAPAQGWVNSIVRKAMGHSLIYGLSVGILPLTSLLLLPVYTRHLSPERFGLLALLMVTSGILSFLYDLGMVNALFRRYFEYDPRQAHQRKVVLSTAALFLIGHAALWTVGLMAAASWLPPIGSYGRLTGIIRLMLLSAWINACADVPLAALRIRGRKITFAVVSLVRSSALVFLTWFLVAVRQQELVGVFVSSLLAGLGTCLLLGVLTMNEFGLAVSLNEFKAMLKFGMPFFPVLFFTWIIDFSDRYFLGLLATLQAVGIYTVGYKIGQIVLLVVKAFMVAWIPLMFSIARNPQAPDAFAQVFRYYLFGVSLLGFLLILWARDLISVLAAASYQGGADIVPLIVGAYLCYAIYSFMLSGLLVTKDVWVQPATLATAALLNALLNGWWIPRLGMYGAAYATIVSYALAAVVTWRAAQRRYPIPVKGRELLGMLAVWAGFCAASFWLKPPAIGKAALLLAYAGTVCLVVGIRPSQLRELWMGIRDRAAGLESAAAIKSP